MTINYSVSQGAGNGCVSIGARFESLDDPAVGAEQNTGWPPF